LVHTKERQVRSKDFKLEFLDANDNSGLCRPPIFDSVRQYRQADRLVYRQFVVEGKFKPHTKKRSEKTEFSVQVSPFQSCVGVPLESAVQVEPKVVNMTGRQGRRRSVMVIWPLLSPFTLTRHRRHQLWGDNPEGFEKWC
jgi:hypothetical protein